MPEKNQKEAKKQIDDNEVFIGIKPFMNYVTAVVMQFSKPDTEKVIIKARGKFISKAVDVSEVARRNFLKETKVKDIKTGSEEYINKEGKPANVSIIEITLGK